MENTTFNKMLLKTGFCCMASDGHIDDKEISLLKNHFAKLNDSSSIDLINDINDLLAELNSNPQKFLHDFFDFIKISKFSKNETLSILEIALNIILADDKIEYSEIKFFKNIRHRLQISDAEICSNFSNIAEIESFLEADIINESSLSSLTSHFIDNISFPTFAKINIGNSF